MKKTFEVHLSERLKQMITEEVIKSLKSYEYPEYGTIDSMTIGFIKSVIQNVAIDALQFNPCEEDLFDILSKVLKGLN